MQSYNYRPSDNFWGQLSGCLEAIDAGTTTVLDHSHGSYTQEHGRYLPPLPLTLLSLAYHCPLHLSPI
jgi:hypothetical protein